MEQLHQYIQSSCYSSSDPQPCQLESHPSIDDEDTIEKHFMCQTDEERDSWLRALRHSRSFIVVFDLSIDWVVIMIQQPGSHSMFSTQFKHLLRKHNQPKKSVKFSLVLKIYLFVSPFISFNVCLPYLRLLPKIHS